MGQNPHSSSSSPPPPVLLTRTSQPRAHLALVQGSHPAPRANAGVSVRAEGMFAGRRRGTRQHREHMHCNHHRGHSSSSTAARRCPARPRAADTADRRRSSGRSCCHRRRRTLRSAPRRGAPSRPPGPWSSSSAPPPAGSRRARSRGSSHQPDRGCTWPAMPAAWSVGRARWSRGDDREDTSKIFKYTCTVWRCKNSRPTSPFRGKSDGVSL